MKKIIIVFLVLFGVSITQAFGQVPVGASLIYKQDFGGNNPYGTTAPYGDPRIATTTVLPAGSTTLNFGTNLSTTNNPPDNGYVLAKTTLGASYGAWWGTGNGATYKPFDDHTFPGDTTRGYMMVVNAADQPSIFFTYTINNLCPNTHLIFSVWAGNLINTGASYQSRLDPILRFALVDPTNPADTLAQSDTIHIYKTKDPSTSGVYDPTNKTNPPGWNQCTFAFTTQSQTSVKLIIFNDQINSNGNDLVMDDIEIYMLAPDITVSSPTSPSYYYCETSPMDLAGSYEDPNGTFGGNAQFAWLYSTDNFANDSTLVSTDSICAAPAQAGWYKVVIGAHGNIDITNPTQVIYGNCCSVSPIVQVQMIPPSTVLYWKPNAASQNWNDYNNWQFANGSTSLYPPSICTDVHIPGNVTTVYPSLDANISGPSSACDNIYFHFGGLIGQPHLLQYDSAYVQYNFGESGGGNGDSFSPAPPMTRNRWYALAAPLQNMVSGDFAFGGFPETWQYVYYTSPNQTPGALAGDWQEKADNTNDWRISAQYNAIAIWVDGDLTNPLAPNYQKNLSGLNGILQIPYYNDAANLSLHGVTQSGNVTSFPYFDYTQPGFPPAIPSDPGYIPPGTIDRGSSGEAFQFIFQDPTLFLKSGSEYSMTVPTNTDIMVGNPFMSDLDFDNFGADNGITSYYLYSYSDPVGGAFTPYNYQTGTISELTNMRYIPPLQAFFINTGSGAGSTKTLMFDADRVAVAAPITLAEKLRASVDNTKPDVLYFKATNKAGVSYLTLSMQKVKDKNLILLLQKDNSAIPSLYATDATRQKNCIQFEGGYVDSIPLGVLSDTSEVVTLTVYNKDKLNTNYLKLVDNYLNKTVDLETTDTYSFTNVPGVTDRFTLMFVNKSMTGITSTEIEQPVSVGASGDMLYVSAGTAIDDVSVITLQGITVVNDTNIGQPSYTKSLQLPAGLYLVSVKLKTGETSVAKVVIK